MDADVQAYIAEIPAAQRDLFDRVNRLILEAFPDADIVMSYKMPTYVTAGKRRLHLGVWKHGLSLYGWDKDRTSEFLDRHPGLDNGKGTLKLTSTAAAAISDDEIRELARATLDA
jgi:uncharacterized protein YdhG (YjbR/CyaY superfamily)